MEQIETIQALDLARAEARLPRWMIACAVAGGAVLTLLGGHVRVAAGFFSGAALAIVNYYWLHSAIQTAFSDIQPRVPKKVLARFILR